MTSSGDRRVVAAFDFDETLISGDSVIPFLRRFAHPVRIAAGLACRPVQAAGALLGRDRDRLRSLATEIVFSGRRHDQVTRQALAHAEHLVTSRFRADTTSRLRWHLEQDHRVVIVSASYDDYLLPVARALGVDHVLATRLEVVDGVCTGRLDGPNCRGAEKVSRLEQWLIDIEVARAEIDVWAYGDSVGDREMLEWADRPVWVTERLASVAPSY